MQATQDRADLKAYDELISKLRESAVLGSTAAILSWDQETMMPPRGVELRSRQMSQLAGMVHQMRTNPRIGELLSECEQDAELTADPQSDTGANLREIRRSYDRATKLPPGLVQEIAAHRSMATHEWAEARQESDFARFRPVLDKSLRLTREVASCYGWPESGEAWDALAEGFEQGMTAAGVEQVFTPLRARLQSLLSDLAGGSGGPRDVFAGIDLPIERQKDFVRMVAGQIGFDFERGRLDTSTHPFCGGANANDVRMTTRFRANGLLDALGGTMHESGHGIYSQGLPLGHFGTPLGSAVSLGIHESQSRMWENQVGRSQSFWRWCYPKLREHFGDAVASLSFEDVYAGANVVERGLIRVEADEATYNMHIMIRFSLERALVSGDLPVDEVPGAWNAAYKEYLDVDVPNDREGCLQDIHWSMGAFGYFPTYTLGNLYAAQLFEAALEAIPNLYDQFEGGEFGALKEWLNRNVHAHGQRHRPEELCEVATGKRLSADPLLRHLESKLRPLYGA